MSIDRRLFQAQFWGMWLLLITGLLVLAGFLYDPLSPSAWFVSVGLGAGFGLFVGATAVRWYCAWRRQRD